MERRKILRRRQNQANRLKALGNRTDLSTTRKMQNPPLIMPNYGKRKSAPGVPKTRVSRVLLYDNITQQHMLDVKVAHIKIEKERVERLFDLHIRSFSARMAMKRRQTSLSGNISEETQEPTKPPLWRNHTKVSDKERVSSAMLVDKFHFPKLEKPGKEIALNLQTRSGKNRTYYSSDESGLFQNLIPLYKFYSNVTEDPRFTKLESMLVGAK